MPTKRTTKRTTMTAETTPMTGAEALEAGRRAYEAAAGSTCAAAPTAEPRPAPLTMRTRHDEAVPCRMTRPRHYLGAFLSRSRRRGPIT
jgi:hypothetical protein